MSLQNLKANNMKRDPFFRQISRLKVLKSAAGYYIGRTWQEREGAMEEPYSRESTYYADRETANTHLNNNTYIQRL